jgi:hypothetical protein
MSARHISPAARHNSSVHFYRVPQEILVSILKLVQGRRPVEGAPDVVQCHPYWSPITAYDKQLLSWRHVMLTCTLARDVAVQSPELWTLISVCWPERWLRLCIERAKDSPFHLIAQVHNLTSARLTTELLSKSRDAVVVFKDNETLDRAEWHKICSQVLTAQATLRSLEFNSQAFGINYSCGLMTISAQMFGGTRSLISRLDIAEMRLVDTPAFPYLEHLRLHAIIPPGNPRWLHRLLATSPHLRTLAVFCRDTAPIERDTMLPLPVALPQLSTFNIGFETNDLCTILHIVPVPINKLCISTWTDHDDTDHQIYRRDNITIMHHVIAYVTQFWSRIGPSQELPSCHIEKRYTSSTSDNWTLCMPQKFHERLSVTVRQKHVGNMGVFLDHTRDCELKVESLDDAETIYPEINQVLTLQRLRITIEESTDASKAAHVQRWADERANVGLSIVKVEIGQHGRRRGITQGEWHARVRWNPTEGPLSEAEWTDIASFVV